jgi:hypothetical protein
MARVQKILLPVFFVCANSAFGTTPEDLREALKPESIEKFSDVACYQLKNKEDIKQCAQVKAFMAQALAEATPGKGKAYVVASSVVIGGVLFFLANQDRVDKLIFTAFLTPCLAGAAFKAVEARSKRNHVKEANAFKAYFEELAENPAVLDRDYAVNHRKEMNEKGDTEEAFNKLCAAHKILESAYFAQYQATRIVPDIEDPRPLGFPGDEDFDSE